MKQFLTATAALFLFSCVSTPTSKTTTTKDNPQTTSVASTTEIGIKDAATAKAKLAKLHQDLNTAADDDRGDVKKIQAINEELHAAWQEIAQKNLWRDTTIQTRDIYNPYSVYLLSPDKKLAIITWNSELGGTMINLQGIAIFETAKGVKTQKLFDNKERNDNFGTSYRELYGLTNKRGKTTYYAYGISKAASLILIDVIHGFQITDKLVENVQVAKGEASGITRVYDLTDARDVKMTGFIFSDDKKQITVQESDEHDIPTSKNSIYVFDGNMYVKQKN